MLYAVWELCILNEKTTFLPIETMKYFSSKQYTDESKNKNSNVEKTIHLSASFLKIYRHYKIYNSQEKIYLQ